MPKHRHPRVRVAKALDDHNFHPEDALRRLHVELMHIEATAYAASMALDDLPFTPSKEGQRAQGRLFALITDVAERADRVLNEYSADGFKKTA